MAISGSFTNEPGARKHCEILISPLKDLKDRYDSQPFDAFVFQESYRMLAR